MGTTCIPNPGNTRKWAEDYLTWEDEHVKFEALDVAVVKWTQVYAAVRHTNKQTGESYVYAAMIRVTRYPSDYYSFCYKAMDETVSPVYCECPERILKQLSDNYEGFNDWAREWRQNCWDNINYRRKRNIMRAAMQCHI